MAQISAQCPGMAAPLLEAIKHFARASQPGTRRPQNKLSGVQAASPTASQQALRCLAPSPEHRQILTTGTRRAGPTAFNLGPPASLSNDLPRGAGQSVPRTSPLRRREDQPKQSSLLASPPLRFLNWRRQGERHQRAWLVGQAHLRCQQTTARKWPY